MKVLHLMMRLRLAWMTRLMLPWIAFWRQAMKLHGWMMNTTQQSPVIFLSPTPSSYLWLINGLSMATNVHVAWELAISLFKWYSNWAQMLKLGLLSAWRGRPMEWVPCAFTTARPKPQKQSWSCREQKHTKYLFCYIHSSVTPTLMIMTLFNSLADSSKVLRMCKDPSNPWRLIFWFLQV